MSAPHRLVVLGGGIAGLEIASQLSRAPLVATRFEVTLIDREPAHIWKPMLHTIAAGTRDVQQHQTTFIAQARERKFIFQPGEVTEVDRAAHQVSVAPLTDATGRDILPARIIGYDTLIIALGSRANDFGTPGVAQHCRTIDSRAQAMAFNDEVRSRLLQAAASGGHVSIGIVGGGATGVELAAELIQLANLAAFYGAEGIVDRLTVTLVESGPRLLAAFPERVALAARTRLEELGIRVLTATQVTAADEAGFQLADGSRLDVGLKVWAAGVRGPQVLNAMDGLVHSRSGQLVVDSHLRVKGDPDIFALGDCAAMTPSGEGRPLPPTAQVAHQQARYLTQHLPGLIAGAEPPPFVFRDAGALVSLGGYGAYGSLGKTGIFREGFIQGRLAQIGHIFLYRSHQARLHGFWRGSLMWLAEMLNDQVRPRIRLD